jgi:hypothetical protein
MADGHWLMAHGRWLLAAGGWLLPVGRWLLVVGCWSLAAGLWHFKTCHSERSEESRSLTSRDAEQFLVKQGDFETVKLRLVSANS